MSGLEKKGTDLTGIRRTVTLYWVQSQWQYSHEEAPLCQVLQVLNMENLISLYR
jgi:hypothetical protein